MLVMGVASYLTLGFVVVGLLTMQLSIRYGREFTREGALLTIFIWPVVLVLYALQSKDLQ